MVVSRSQSTDVWAVVLDFVRAHTKPQQFETWFRSLECVLVSPDQIEIRTPNAFYRKWMETHYADLLLNAFQEILDAKPTLTFTVKTTDGEMLANDGVADASPSDSPSTNKADVRSGPRASSATTPPSGGTASTVELPSRGLSGDVRLNPQYSFGNFVVGPSNRLAHAASLAVTENLARAYNPLFLHGDVGMGKTHLLQAICSDLLRKTPDLRVVYLSCEAFVNEYISALQKGNPSAFRNRYRHVEVLVIDDIHFLASKKALQEEFFHTFNTLYNCQNQIILSSDGPPQDIPDLEARLVSRFKWGLVAEIEPPHYETRVAIIQRKAKLRQTELPQEVVEYIANALDTNIREIEGAVLKIIVMAGLQNQRIDIALCKTALKELTNTGMVSITDIMSQVAKHFHVKISDLQGKKRSKSIVLPRQICMYLGRQLTKHSLEEIGGHFGGRDHTTVLYSETRIRELFEKDTELRSEIEKISRELQRSSG